MCLAELRQLMGKGEGGVCGRNGWGRIRCVGHSPNFRVKCMLGSPKIVVRRLLMIGKTRIRIGRIGRLGCIRGWILSGGRGV